VASFTISNTAPLTLVPVTFTSTGTDSDGTVVKHEWDFDADGSYDASGKTVNRSFPLPGLQLVTLRVTDEDGASHTLGKTLNVTNRAPSATISMGTASPISLEPVNFTAAGVDQDGSITSYLWDFDNDGQFDDAAGESVPWTFNKKGTYPVKVKVTDDRGASATGTRSVNVANTLPRATFAYDPASPNPRDVVTLTSTSLDPDGSITKIEWDTDNDGAFDDGTTAKVTKAFTTPGNQTVRMRVTDDDDGQVIGSQTIVIGNRPPTASFDFRPAAPTAGQLVTFFSTADDPDKNIERIDWDLDGDGAYEASGSSASRTFSAGSFNVSMRVTDTGDSFAIVTQTIVVGVPPAAPKGETTRLRALTPFPIVRMAGHIGKRGTRFRLLTVDVPGGSTVTVRCSGKGCPFKKNTRAARAARKLRIRQLEKRMLRSGVTIKIFVTQAGTIGKYTSIKIRGGKPPKRVDRCLMPGSMRPAKCQS
jgi:PKD repeat protein